MERRKVKDIIVRKPLRKDLGDLRGLAASIKEFGLLHPIGITAAGELVFGRRRLEAHKLLGKPEIEVRVFHD